MPFRLLPPPLEFRPDQLYRVPTDDGSAIALGRYHPRGPRRFEEPVVLGHSLAANRFNLDFDERYSVARFLARRGFETWVLELRGHGLAGSAHGSSFDVEVEQDVRAAIRAVRSTGSEKVLWVGHSRGGLLPLAHLARNPGAPLGAIATLGAPTRFDVQVGMKHFVTAVTPVMQLPVIPVRLARAYAPLGLPPNPIGRYLVRKENMEPLVIRQAIAHVSADIPGGLARQMARWVKTGGFDGDDGFDYRKGLHAVRVPVLLLAGSADELAPARAVHDAKRYLGGPVEVVTAGRAHGHGDDYGHGDLVLGRRAPEEIFTRVADFLEQHASRVRAA